MPRKTPSRTRKPAASKRKRKSSTSASRSRRVFRQCLICGAQVDAMYGTGDTSWCPHCHESDSIFEQVGELPDPQLYGSWLLGQEEKAAAEASPSSKPASARNSTPPLTTSPVTRGSEMKNRKLHTGIYSCPRCCLEFDLLAEASLKCDECQGPLVSGSLDELWENGEDDDD